MVSISNDRSRIIGGIRKLVEYNKAVVDEQALPLCHYGNKEVHICKSTISIYT